jgi:hypothetical protein
MSQLIFGKWLFAMKSGWTEKTSLTNPQTEVCFLAGIGYPMG